MKPSKVKYSREFFKDLKKVPKEQLRFLKEKEKIFRKDIFDPRLKTHKLKGKLVGFYSFSVSYRWRIIFQIEGNDVIFHAIGTHSIYK